jgi:hypothetical protein
VDIKLIITCSLFLDLWLIGSPTTFNKMIASGAGGNLAGWPLLPPPWGMHKPARFHRLLPKIDQYPSPLTALA